MVKRIYFREHPFYLFLFLLLFGSLNSLMAQQPKADHQEQLKSTIQLRPRAEVRNGLSTPQLTTQDLAAFISQRNPIGLNYSKGNILERHLTGIMPVVSMTPPAE
jgi:hypothetical protein